MPYDGAVLDQPAGLLDKMATLLNVYDAMTAATGARNIVEWSNSNPQAGRIVARVMKMRMGL